MALAYVDIADLMANWSDVLGPCISCRTLALLRNEVIVIVLHHAAKSKSSCNALCLHTAISLSAVSVVIGCKLLGILLDYVKLTLEVQETFTLGSVSVVCLHASQLCLSVQHIM